MGILDTATKPITAIGAFIRNPLQRSVDASGFRGDDFKGGFVVQEFKPEAKNFNPGNKSIDENDEILTELVLGQTFLPKDSVPFGGDQRMIKEFYPGNSEPVVHILGPEETDIVINGTFNDKHLNLSNAVESLDDGYGVAAELMIAFDDMRIRGNVVRIKLGEFQRYCFLKNTDFQLKKLGMVDYKLTFDIIGFKPPLSTQFAGQNREIPFETNEELEDLLFFFNEAYSQIPDNVPGSIADLLNGLISEVASAIDNVTSAIDNLIGTAEDLEGSVNRTLGVVNNALVTVRNFKRRVGSIGLVPTNFSKSNAAAAFGGGITFLSGSISTAVDFQTLLNQLRAQFASIIATVPLRRHQVRDTDTLQRLAFRFYDDDQQWKKIFDHNNLSDTDLVSGQVLEIPRIDT